MNAWDQNSGQTAASIRLPDPGSTDRSATKARLVQICDALGLPATHFDGAGPARRGNTAGTDGMAAQQAETARLIEAFARIADRDARLCLIELAETLSSSPPSPRQAGKARRED